MQSSNVSYVGENKGLELKGVCLERPRALAVNGLYLPQLQSAPVLLRKISSCMSLTQAKDDA